MRTLLTIAATVLVSTVLGGCASPTTEDASTTAGSVRRTGGAKPVEGDCTAAARASGACAAPAQPDGAGAPTAPSVTAPLSPCDAAEKAFLNAKDLDQKNQTYGCGGGHNRQDVFAQIGLAIALCPSYTEKFRTDGTGFDYRIDDPVFFWDMLSARWTWGNLVVRDASGTAVWTGLERAIDDTRFYATVPGPSGSTTGLKFGFNGQFSWMNDSPNWTYGMWSLGAIGPDGSIDVVVTPLAGGATRHYALTQDTATVDGKTVPIPNFILTDAATGARFATQVGCTRDAY